MQSISIPTFIILIGLGLTGCATAQQKAQIAEAQAAHAEKVSKVRFISPKETETCEYVNQTSITQDMSFLGGQIAMENGAKKKLKSRAPLFKANGIRITDRQLDKGRGGYDKTRLTLYADFYVCEEAPK